MMMRSSSLSLRLGGVLAAGAAVAAVAGCSAGGSSSAPAAPTSATSAAASTTAAAPTSAPASSAAASAATSAATSSPHAIAAPSTSKEETGGAAAGCATADLRIKAGTGEGAAGSLYQTLDFTNIGSSACTLYGYPGVSLAAGTPAAQVGLAASRSTTTGPTLVTLKPGQTGNAVLRITQALNYPSATCSPAATTYLRIYPPNQTSSIDLAFKSTGCTSTKVNLLTISVVQAGAESTQ
jgi:Protein of unknown function (DUF4232)